MMYGLYIYIISMVYDGGFMIYDEHCFNWWMVYISGGFRLVLGVPPVLIQSSWRLEDFPFSDTLSDISEIVLRYV